MAVFKAVKTMWRCDQCGKDSAYLEDDPQTIEGWVIAVYSDMRWCSDECREQWGDGIIDLGKGIVEKLKAHPDYGKKFT